MKNISSKKLVSAVIISGLSLQLIPFNAFAASSLSNTTEIKGISNVSNSSTLSDNMISLRGTFISSNPIKVNMRFDQKDKKILLELGHTMPNPSFRDKVYMTVQLFDKFGKLKNSFSLKGTDYPEVNESVKKFNEQEFEYGDFLKISHEEAGKNVIIRGKVMGTQDDFSTKGVSKDTLKNSFFKITKNGLELVKDEVTTKVTGSCWINDRSFAMKGFVGTGFEMPKTSDKKQLLIKDASQKVIETIDMKSTNEYSEDDDDYRGFNVSISEDIFKQIPVGTYDLYVEFNQNGQKYEKPLKQDPIQNSIESKDIHFEKDINNSDTMYFYPSPNHCLSYKFKTNGNNEVQLEVKVHNK